MKTTDIYDLTSDQLRKLVKTRLLEAGASNIHDQYWENAHPLGWTAILAITATGELTWHSFSPGTCWNPETKDRALYLFAPIHNYSDMISDFDQFFYYDELQRLPEGWENDFDGAVDLLGIDKRERYKEISGSYFDVNWQFFIEDILKNFDEPKNELERK